MLGLFYWFPVFALNFYLNFALNKTVIWGPALFIPTTVIALLVSNYVS